MTSGTSLDAKMSSTGTNSLLMLLFSLTSWRRHWADICSRAISPAQPCESVTGADWVKATHTRALIQRLFGVNFGNVSSHANTWIHASSKMERESGKKKKAQGLLKQTRLLLRTVHVLRDTFTNVYHFRKFIIIINNLLDKWHVHMLSGFLPLDKNRNVYYSVQFCPSQSLPRKSHQHWEPEGLHLVNVLHNTIANLTSAFSYRGVS